MVKWNKVTHASLFISFITMTLMAYGGYATFTSSVQGMYVILIQSNLVTLGHFLATLKLFLNAVSGGPPLVGIGLG